MGKTASTALVKYQPADNTVEGKLRVWTTTAAARALRRIAVTPLGLAVPGKVRRRTADELCKAGLIEMHGGIATITEYGQAVLAYRDKFASPQYHAESDEIERLEQAISAKRAEKQLIQQQINALTAQLRTAKRNAWLQEKAWRKTKKLIINSK